jgi:hypothetical protein
MTREKVMVKEGTLEQILAIYDNLPVDEKAEVLKKVLDDPNLLLYLSFLDRKYIGVILETIANHILLKAE